MASRNLLFVVDGNRDQDILAWWERQENKSAAVRAAIRQTMQSTVTVGDLAIQIAEVTAKLEVVQASVEDLARRGATMSLAAGSDAGAESVEETVPADVLANLDALGR